MLSCFSHILLFVMLWTVAHQAPLSRQEYWSRLPCPPPGNLPEPGIEPMSPVASEVQADSLPLSHLGSPLGWRLNIKFKTIASITVNSDHGMYARGVLS